MIKVLLQLNAPDFLLKRRRKKLIAGVIVFFKMHSVSSRFHLLLLQVGNDYFGPDNTLKSVLRTFSLFIVSYCQVHGTRRKFCLKL